MRFGAMPDPARARVGEQLTLMGAGLDGPSDLHLADAIAEFSRFPYQRPPLSARNWGHPLHSLCSYPSKMKPALAATLVRLFTAAGDVVLDPFAGVGTIPFEACLAGRVGIAGDLSPFAFGVSAAKVRPPSRQQVEESLDALAAAISKRSGSAYSATEGDTEIADFFHPETWAEVRMARAFFLERERLAQATSGHWLVKAALAHVLHGNRPYALSRRSHGIIPIPPKGPAIYKPLIPTVRDKVRRTRFDQLPGCFVNGVALMVAAQHLPVEDDSVNAIITSPPFLGTTDFLRQNRVRLWFYGMDYLEQREKRRGSLFLEGQRDLSTYDTILREVARVLRARGLAIFHLGVVSQRDMAVELAPLAAAAGLSPIATLYESASHLESHGRTDRGATAKHAFVFLQREPRA